jgi:replicative DNA helicase
MKGQGESRRVELQNITRDMKLISLDYDLPIVMLAQINRNASDKRPTLADLKDSGSIEEDSDNVILLHEVTKQDLDQLKDYLTQLKFESEIKEGKKYVLLTMAKHRNGQAGVHILTRFEPQRYIFIEERRI